MVNVISSITIYVPGISLSCIIAYSGYYIRQHKSARYGVSRAIELPNFIIVGNELGAAIAIQVSGQINAPIE